METREQQVRIELAEGHRDLAEGRHTVCYVALSNGTLWCISESDGRRVLECPAFRFVKVSRFDIRITDDRRVSTKIGEVWIDLGPLFLDPSAPGRGMPAVLARPDLDAPV